MSLEDHAMKEKNWTEDGASFIKECKFYGVTRGRKGTLMTEPPPAQPGSKFTRRVQKQSDRIIH